MSSSSSGLGAGGQVDGPTKREEDAILEGIAFARRAEAAERRVEELEAELRALAREVAYVIPVDDGSGGWGSRGSLYHRARRVLLGENSEGAGSGG